MVFPATTNGAGAHPWTSEESGGVVREDPLQQRDDLFRILVESSPDLFFRLSKEGEIAYLSPASRMMFGCAPAHGNPRHYLAFIVSAAQPLAARAFQLLLGGARDQEIVLEMVRPDDQLIQVAVHATPWFDGNRIVGVQGSIRELSEQEKEPWLLSRTSRSRPRQVRGRQDEPPPQSPGLHGLPGKQAEHEQLAAYYALEQMFNLAAPFCLLSTECRVLKVNRAFCDFFGRRPEDVLGKTGQDIWGCEACGTAECPHVQLLAGAAPSYLEIDKIVHGRHLVCTLRAVPYLDDAGRMSGMGITFFDGQERKKISLELLNTQQQLIHAEKLSAIGSLAASIAHEFNNPLCGVRSVVERMARKSGLAPTDQGLLKLALEECDRMTRLIKDLQQFNLPFTDIRKAFDLHRAIDSVLLLLNKHLKSRKALLHKEYARGTMSIVGVENQIKQVLLNLLKNCSEALPLTGGVIRIQTRRDREHVHVVLSDTGVGISAEHLPHLFEPFFTTKPAVKEVGLGLAVSYGIIKGHRGDIRVESIMGEGTTFTVVLPIGVHCQ
ncbi:MAG: PAS domain-containing protein [Desulfobulbaceae bacterium]|nr:PAS domain-containing protein [Desulfobulbaceae bacterium]